MIPPLNDDGYLPPGLHPAELDEIEARFGVETEIRQAQIQSLRWLADLAKRAGIIRLVVNGSFVTATSEPNDVDCVLLIGPDFPCYPEAIEELDAGLPFLSLQVVHEADFRLFVEGFFATDFRLIAKGMVEVIW